MKARWLLAALLPLLAGMPAWARQAADPRAAFVEALGQFSLALEGAYGDEGARLRSSVEAMERALDAWDQTIAGYEAAMAAERPGAPPPLAARMHMALGGVYLDRGRVQDALREFAAASELDPGRADVHSLMGVARSQGLGDLPGAVAAFRKAAALDVDDPVRAYLLARHLDTLGETAESTQAVARFRAIVRQRAEQGSSAAVAPFIRLGLVPESSDVEPFFPPVRYADGFALLETADYRGALASFRDAVGHDPLAAGTPTEPQLRAAAAFRDGAAQEAAAQLQRAVAASPDSAEPHRLLGLVYAADRQHDMAVAELRIAVRLNPADERARVGLANVLVAAGELDAAETVLSEAIAAFPESGRAHYLLARTYERQGKYPETLRELRAAAERRPLIGANGIYQTIGAIEASRQEFESAAAAYTRRVDVHPNDPDAHHDLGDIYSRLGRHEQALAEFTVAAMLDPSRAETHAAMAQLHMRDGQYEEAIASARRALRIDPGHEQARYTLATSLIRADQPEEGRRELEVFQRLQAASAAARSRIFEVEGLRREATVAAAAGDHEQAVALLRRVFVLQPTAAATHLDLGLALLKAGQAAEAVDRLSMAAALDESPDVHRHLSEAYAALGQGEDSRRELATYERLKQDALRRRSAGR